MSNRIWFWVGIAILIYLPVMIVWNLCHTAGHWQLGPHCVPVPLEGDTAGFYPDGTPINIVDCLILRSGQAELIYALLIGTVTVSLIWFVLVIRSTRKLRREAEEMLAALEELFPEPHSPVVGQAKQSLQSVKRQMTWFVTCHDDKP